MTALTSLKWRDINISSINVIGLNNTINGDFVIAGSTRVGQKTAKDETKESSSLAVKSRNKQEEVMDWEADTKDILDQLLRDDVIIYVN